MSWSAALPGAALRTLRTAAGRRALQVALLLGGLLVIGLVWGEQAHAENGVNGVGVRPEGRAGEAGGVGRQGPVDAQVEASLSPSSSWPGPVSHQAVRGLPAVSDHPGSNGSPGLPDAPALRDVPALPTLPGLPDSPAQPDLPGLSDLPDLPPPPGDPDVELPGAPAPPAPPAPLTPVTADPQPGGASVQDSGTVPVDEAAPSRQAGKPDTPVSGHEPHATPAGPEPHGIHATHLRPAHPLGHSDHVSRPDRLSHPGRPGHPGSSPHAGRTPVAGHAPGGRPDGVLGNRSMADSGSSRHGETHAVTPSPWAPLAPGSGVGAGASKAGAGCGHRDIPLFPG
ncbi:hypothetical protein [Streptomyces iakyrus]|uniref:hypothetical protein n=1 Tax=Streptomyces iakyrus TaxID=68219 RepID=UPI0036F6E07E